METRYTLHLVIPNVRYGELLFRYATLNVFHEGPLPDHVYQDQLHDRDWTDVHAQTAVDSTFSKDEVLALTSYFLPMSPDSELVVGPKDGYEPNEIGVKLDPGSHYDRKRWFFDFDPEPPIPVRGYFNARREELILPDVDEPDQVASSQEPPSSLRHVDAAADSGKRCDSTVGHQGPAKTTTPCSRNGNMRKTMSIRSYIAQRLGIDENELDLGDPENILDAPINSELGRIQVEDFDLCESLQIPLEESLPATRWFFSDVVRRFPEVLQHVKDLAKRR